MLEALKKMLAPKEQAQEEQISEEQASADLADPSMKEDLLQTAMDMLAVSEQTIAELVAKNEELVGKLEEYSQFAAEAEAKAEAIAQAAAAAALSARKEKLASVIGEDNPGFDSTFAAISKLADEDFSVVVEGFAASFKQEAQTKMFVEQGVTAEANVEDAKTENATMKIIKQQYK